MCRNPGSTTYTGYDTDSNTDISKCQDKCLKDSKCNAFEYNGSSCWYYSGQESPQPGLAGTANQCYVKIPSGMTKAQYVSDPFMTSGPAPSWCRKEGGTDYSGYTYTTDIDTAGCKSKCLADASCKAVEVDDKNTCWYYNDNEYSQPAPSTESGHRCLRRK